MPVRYLHFVTLDGLQTSLVARGGVQNIDSFTADPAGHTAFAEWLSHAREGLHTLLVDVPDEGFHLENIPYVIGPDRRALIARKLTQQFFGASFSTALSLGRSTDGRRDERVLFAAITRSDHIDPWLSALQAAQAAVAAVLSVPLLTSDLVRYLCPNEKRGLILLLSPSGIRQIFFEQGQLRFSRLSPAPDGPFASWGPDCLRETQKTVQYLSAQRWIARGTPLRVHVVISALEAAPLLADIERLNAAPDTLQFTGAPIETLASKLDPGLVHQSSDARALILRLAARNSGRAQLAPASERHYYRLWQARFAVLAVAGIAFCASLLLAAKWTLQAHSERIQAESLESSAQMETLRYHQLVAQLPAMPTSLESLRATVDNIDRQQAQISDPRDALVLLSHVLDEFSDIALDDVTWNDGSGSDQIATASAGEAPRQRLIVNASLDTSSAQDPRATLARIRAFADALRQRSHGDVNLQRLPFEVESDKTLKSDAQATGARPAFRLQLTLGGHS